MAVPGEPMLNIGELASLTGVSSRTIRYYEELGILPEPERSAGGTRRYPRDYRFYIEGARALKDLGFNLEEIRVIGQMALGRPTTGRQRDTAAEVVRERTRALEHKIRVLERLRGLLHTQEAAGGVEQDPERMLEGLADIIGANRKPAPRRRGAVAAGRGAERVGQGARRRAGDGVADRPVVAASGSVGRHRRDRRGRAQPPVNRGGRFSSKALRPSSTSRVRKIAGMKFS